MTDQLSLIVCQNFRSEAAAVIQSAGCADARVVAFPATCSRPAAGADSIGRLARLCAAQGAEVVALGGHCLRRLADDHRTAPAAAGVRVVALARCLELAAAAPLVDAQIAAGAYLLTPGWLSRWRRYMAEWGFDQGTAREFFAETTRKLVLLDTGVNGDSETHLRELADFLALPYEVIPVGLSLLRQQIFSIPGVIQWTAEHPERRASGVGWPVVEGCGAGKSAPACFDCARPTTPCSAQHATAQHASACGTA
jgi:hypothetical protein